DANIAIVLEYPSLGKELQATGLYFKYQKNGLPLPVLDKLKVKASAWDALTAGLTSLGGEIPDIGLPIKVIEPPKFGGKKPGSVSFKVRIGLDSFFGADTDVLKMDLGVTVYPGSKRVDLDGPMKATIPGQVAIGTSGLFLFDNTVTLQPKDKKAP